MWGYKSRYGSRVQGHIQYAHIRVKAARSSRPYKKEGKAKHTGTSNLWRAADIAGRQTGRPARIGTWCKGHWTCMSVKRA